jgi:hypothetical protein
MSFHYNPLWQINLRIGFPGALAKFRTPDHLALFDQYGFAPKVVPL